MVRTERVPSFRNSRREAASLILSPKSERRTVLAMNNQPAHPSLAWPITGTPHNLLAAVTTDADAVEGHQQHRANQLLCANRLKSICIISP